MLAELAQQELCTSRRAPRELRTLHAPSSTQSCPRHCTCGERPPHERTRLAYFATLPNYGQTHALPLGSSREAFGYLQFILDFYDNLPKVVVFSHDDVEAGRGAWGAHLANGRLARRLAAWSHEWGEHTPITRQNCGALIQKWRVEP